MCTTLVPFSSSLIMASSLYCVLLLCPAGIRTRVPRLGDQCAIHCTMLSHWYKWPSSFVFELTSVIYHGLIRRGGNIKGNDFRSSLVIAVIAEDWGSFHRFFLSLPSPHCFNLTVNELPRPFFLDLIIGRPSILAVHHHIGSRNTFANPPELYNSFWRAVNLRQMTLECVKLEFDSRSNRHE